MVAGGGRTAGGDRGGTLRRRPRGPRAAARTPRSPGCSAAWCVAAWGRGRRGPGDHEAGAHLTPSCTRRSLCSPPSAISLPAAGWRPWSTRVECGAKSGAKSGQGPEQYSRRQSGARGRFMPRRGAGRLQATNERRASPPPRPSPAPSLRSMPPLHLRCLQAGTRPMRPHALWPPAPAPPGSQGARGSASLLLGPTFHCQAVAPFSFENTPRNQ